MNRYNHLPKARLAVGRRQLTTAVLASVLACGIIVAMNRAYAHGDSQAAHAMPMHNMQDDGHGSGAMHDSDQGPGTMHGVHEESGQGHGHAHTRWIDPPSKYASRVNPDWSDQAAMKRGRRIFTADCVVCHGKDGRGSGPAAPGLSHKPADLTNHFHRGPGLGDGYLFWRVSEGGTVEPFHSQGSAMPAFRSVLSERQRWDVLTYVHQLFHKTFKGGSAHDDDEHADGHMGVHGTDMH